LRLLEIGCGHGNLLAEAQAQGYRVQGIEFSADAAERANRKLGFDAVRVAATSFLEFSENSFDVCVLADVLEHVRDPRRALDEVSSMLDRDAVIYIATPNAGSLTARLMGRHWIEFKPEHLFYFTPQAMTRLLGEMGFSDVEIGAGRKVLTADYIFGHFDKYPVPLLNAGIRAARACVPGKLLQRELNVSASGMDIFARRLIPAATT
jgi:SAM-dependent methyltransferase